MEEEEILAKLNALRKIVQRRLIDPKARYFDPKFNLEVFERFTPLRDGLKSIYPNLFNDLPIRDMPQPTKTTDFEGRGYIHRSRFELLLEDINYCFDTLSYSLKKQPTLMKVTREGIFFAGHYFDALQRLTDILSDAKKSIVIIDNYIAETVLNLLTSKKTGVGLFILTSPKSVTPALRTAATAFNKQYGDLSIRTSQAFHDRFLIIDDSDFYHFGASLKDLGNKGFMFSRVEEPDVINALRTKWDQEWSIAKIGV